ncbi:MAG: uridine monophosphate kinase [Defluviitaleaceae bacterium]|nr:uridine monophosphate kinase [Defluviitaleaceae bacterium]
MLNRVVIKLSGEAIGGEAGYNDAVISSIIGQITRAVRAGTQVALVVGGGNYWRGRQASPETDRVKADQIGMLATIMNAIYLADAFRRAGQGAKVLTPMPVGNITTLYEKDAALEMLAAGTVLINAGGTGHPFFSTDTIAALRAAELNADCVLYAKNTDGTYDADPKKNPTARKFRTLSYETAVSRNLNVADITALQLTREAGIPSYVFELGAPESITRACAYPDTQNLNGTYISQSSKEEYYGHESV